MPPEKNPYRLVFDRLLAAFGPQGWWPAETPFEVMVGAVLTQNTAWVNVERAMAALKASGTFGPEALLQMPDRALAALIRPAGFLHIKTRRLKAFLNYFVMRYAGDAARMQAAPAAALRRELLGVHGVGPETADCILLYALEKPSFVVDAYTRRIFSRLGLVAQDVDYHRLQQRFTDALPEDVMLYKEYHALIVALGKHICRPKPRCGRCPLQEMCPVGKQNADWNAECGG